MGTGDLNYRQFVLRELEVRKRRNPQYSLRAYARDLAIPAPKLSQILSGQCGMSGARAMAIAERIGLSEGDTELFVSLVEAEHSRSSAGRSTARRRVEALKVEGGYSEIDLERYKIISDWYHFAILELSEVRDFDPSPKWIAKRLGISTEEAKVAIERLLDFGLIVKDEKKGLAQTHVDLATPSGIPSREIRNHHSQILAKAENSLHHTPVDQRDFSAMIMAIDSKDLDRARKALREFRRKFTKNLQEKSDKDRVYCLSIQLFPLDTQETSQ